MSELAKKKCSSCHDKDLKPLSGADLNDYLDEVSKWKIDADHKKISREFVFKDFVKAVDFVSGVIADIAEEEGHHPDIHISYNKVTLELYTHAIGGLSENDFIVASKIDAIFP
ncbi:MAG: 4a-hydroxytetrahydrobiopterin dehydratase [Patescibacteria group bacterium]